MADNDYERACDRFTRIAESRRKIIELAEYLTEFADREYEAAEDDVRQFEEKHGILKKEYR
jgi:hypothetical protein